MRRLLGADPAAISRLSAVEICSALVRRCREGAFSVRERARALDALERDLSFFQIVELSPPVVAGARALLLRHPLRSGDAIQLASALLLERELESAVGLVAFDDRLIEAAQAEGLTVLS